MNIQLRVSDAPGIRKAFFIGCGIAILFMALTVLQDLVEADFKRTGFYFSESFLFSSFWWLFVPLICAQFYMARTTSGSFAWIVPAAAISIALHLYLYPVLVWLLSSAFCDHTFRMQQTFQYALSTYLIQLVLLYTMPLSVLQYFNRRKSRLQNQAAAIISQSRSETNGTLVVSDAGVHTKILLRDVLFFSANTPYIDIHVNGKKYIHNETLKSIQAQIGDNFMRIHKSTIVNILHVQGYKSRLNGDYDLTMTDGSKLRISRNFAAAFKRLYVARASNPSI